MARHIAIGAGVLGALALVGVASAVGPLGGPSEGEPDGPVIPIGEDWDDYPTAEVTGKLTLDDDCLLIAGTVVFWPEGTTWDEDAQAVEFGGDFDGAPDAPVGEEFTGGGGSYSLANVEGLEAVDAVAVGQCIESTGSNGAVMAYPGGGAG